MTEPAKIAYPVRLDDQEDPVRRAAGRRLAVCGQDDRGVGGRQVDLVADRDGGSARAAQRIGELSGRDGHRHVGRSRLGGPGPGLTRLRPAPGQHDERRNADSSGDQREQRTADRASAHKRVQRDDSDATDEGL
jgi:hypothetical protein